MNCDDFQNQISALVASGVVFDDLRDHPHVEGCAVCRQLIDQLETITSAAAQHLHPSSDEWPEST